MTNLLNTSTVNFQDLIGNGKSYKVPPYQRDYSWTEEQWEDIWQDLLELLSDKKNRHYMGAVVVKAETDREFLIIDGQQRIATLTILALAVIKHLQAMAETIDHEQNLERAKTLRARFIGDKDPASLLEISKLTLNQYDNGFFQDYLVQLREPNLPRALPRSNKLLWECYQYFLNQLKTQEMFQTNGQKVAELMSEVVARQLLFILITVDDELSGYTVFETLNARGLELTTADLLKNYLFSKFRAKNDIDSAQRRWQILIGKTRQEKFSQFLRFHYLTKYPQIRTGRLFKVIREEVKTAQNALELLEVLEKRAEVFEALNDPSHLLWFDIPEAKVYIRELNLFKATQMTPLLFTGYEQLNSAEFVKVLKLISTITFRYHVISGLNPNEMEKAYHRAAKAVMNQEASTASAIFDLLLPVYVSDEKFRSDFEIRQFSPSSQGKKIAKYILCKLESDADGKARDFETDPGTIEHILPENPSEEWESSFPRPRWEDWVYRLGNLTLLEASFNRDLNNMPYSTKVSVYATSAYQLNQQIAVDAPEAWTPNQIENRQKKMAQRALHLWRADF